MNRKTISGEESIALGALQAGATVITGYPGSPSSHTLQILGGYAERYGLHVEWSTNEKVAFETAAGASIGGAPTMMACKGVGFNVALDPIMVANLTDVGAGLVILLGDDPGAWASQNDQDTRPIAWGTELPALEPATPSEGIALTGYAFALSREFQMPVIVRITKSFGGMTEEVELPAPVAPVLPSPHPFEREPMRWISLPVNAVSLHKRLHARNRAMAEAFEAAPYNRCQGSGRYGVLASGFVWTKLLNILEDTDISDLRLMKLSTLWPLPEQTLCSFIRSVEQVLILEENEPFIETHVKRIAYDAGLRVPISGKYDDAVSREGELFRWQIAESLMSFIPGFSPTRSFSPESEKKDMPSLTGIPENCPYTPVFETLLTLGEALNIRPVYVVDPGCAVKINTPPFEMLDIKYSMGSSIGIASGLVLAGISDPVIAVVGDSDFFHLAINALFNVAYQGSDLLVIVLDNDTTALSGFQPVPNRDARVFGRRVTRLNIEDLAAACPVSMVETVDPWNPEGMREVLRKGLTKSGVRVIISRSPCPYIDKKFCPGYKAAGQTHEAPV